MSSVTLWHCDCLILRYVYGCLFHLLEKIQRFILLGRFFAWPAGHLHLAALNSYLPTLANCLLRPQRKEIRTLKNKKNFQVQQKFLISKVKKYVQNLCMECCFPSSFSSVKPINGFQTFNCKPSFNSICNRQRQSSKKVILAKLFHKIIIRHVNFLSVSARGPRVFFLQIVCLFALIFELKIVHI